MKDLLVWKALSDPTRRELLDLLKERPQTTGELCAAFEKLSRFAVMKHLRVLEAVKLVVVRRDGRQRWNHLNAVPLRQIYERWVSKYESEWAGALLKLNRAQARWTLLRRLGERARRALGHSHTAQTKRDSRVDGSNRHERSGAGDCLHRARSEGQSDPCKTFASSGWGG
ncbi:helix-turn-helix transcriptional regulator [Candidatus Acetothermia bacterium]|nr:helix-turn-helix transcriptional regulator [Candidatus Acetothermia bacterium]